MKKLRNLMVILGVLMSSNLFSKDTYKRPHLPNKWQQTASKITSNKRAPASVKEESSSELVTLDEIVGKNKKRHLPSTWRYDLRN